MNFFQLTLPQMNIYSTEVTSKDTDINVVYYVPIINENIDVGIMKKAINDFIKDNDAVRTRIHYVDTIPMQYFAEFEPVEIDYIDLTHLDFTQQQQLFTEWGQVHFQFTDAKLFDYRILKLDADKYALFTKYHHIWCDGWGLGLKWSIIFDNYANLLNNSTVKSKTFTVIDAVKTDNIYRNSEQFLQDKQFWEQYLSDLSLSDDYINPSKRDNNSASIKSFKLDAEFSQQIDRYAKAHNIKPYMVFMTAIAIREYLSKGADEVLVGLPRLNRDTEQERATIGMFVSETITRVKPQKDNCFLDVCNYISEQTEKIISHKKYPLSSISEDIKKLQGINRKLIDASLSYQKTQINTTLNIDDVWFGSPANMFENYIQHIYNYFNTDEYTVLYYYRTALFNQTTLEYLHDALMQIIKTGIENASMPIANYSICGVVEATYINEFGRLNDSITVPNKTVLDAFAKQVLVNPNKVALISNDKNYTYKQADEISNAIAKSLVNKGVKRDCFTGVMLERDADSIVATIAILKAGGAFLWLDSKIPKDRLAYMLSDTNTNLIITSKEICGDLINDNSIVTFEELSNNDISPLYINPLPTDLCYCIYTSGTTGNPKGTLLEHKGFYNHINPQNSPMVDAIATTGKVMVAICSMSFDLSISEIFCALLNGVTVVLASNDDIENTLLLAEKFEKYSVDTLFITPTRLLSYFEYDIFPQALCNLKVVMCGGETFNESLYHKLKEHCPDIRVFNGYGPTEASMATSFKEVDDGETNIGKPVKNYKIRILSKHGTTVPIGTVGEMYIGGIGIGRGYLNIAEETNKKFVSINNEIFYKTGDLAAYNKCGEIRFFGRADNQIKLRGFRIELDEIRTNLDQIDDIDSCAVVVKDQGKTSFIMAVYTSQYELDEEHLKNQLLKKLPYYMVPSVFIRITDLPKTTGGKIDTRALENLEISISTEFVPPHNENQEKLCRIFQSILGYDRVGITDNFFDLGGNSFFAAKAVVEAKFHGIEITYSALFKTPTIKELCADTINLYLENDTEVTDFDYTIFDDVLKWKNEIPQIYQPQNILITGATGYLGLHIVVELLKNSNSNIYCLVRYGKKTPPIKRLLGLLSYYFGDDFSSYINKRLFVVAGDVTLKDIFDQPTDVGFDLVINAAANVSHFSHGDSIYDCNVNGVKHLIEYCLANNSRLIQISTSSVGEFGRINQTQNHTFCEQDLYFNQDVTNQYIKTKFIAEREVLSAVKCGLNANIIRVGNLQGRFSDGKFQINSSSNAFIKRLHAYIKLEFAPLDDFDIDYSPVDFVATAISIISLANTTQAVFHVFSNKKIKYSAVLDVLERINYKIERVTSDDYRNRIAKILRDSEKRLILADFVSIDVGRDFEVNSDCIKTTEFLLERGFKWPTISHDYLQSCLNKISDAGAFR